MNLQYKNKRVSNKSCKKVNIYLVHLFGLDFVLAGTVDIAEAADTFVA
jgi:hypothetical protein